MKIIPKYLGNKEVNLPPVCAWIMKTIHIVNIIWHDIALVL